MSKKKVEAEQSERFQMRLSPGFLEKLDAWRRKQADLPSRAEALRRLAEAGIAAGKPRKRKTARPAKSGKVAAEA